MALSVTVCDEPGVRRVVLFGFMEPDDAYALTRVLPPVNDRPVRVVAERIWRCEPACLDALLTAARACRCRGATFSWVLPSPILRVELGRVGELAFVAPSDAVDRRLTASWPA